MNEFSKKGGVSVAKLNKDNIAVCILTTSSYEEAAEKSGVSKSTLYRLRKDPEFQETVNRIKNDIFQDTMKKAQLDFAKRVFIGVAVFFVPVLVDLVMDFADILWASEEGAILHGLPNCPL